MCSGSAEPSIWLAQVLAGQLLKFCDHATYCNAPKLNNSQNLNLDFLTVSFWVQLTWAHRSAGKCNEDLWKLGKKYLNNLLCKVGPFFLQHSKTFDTSRAFLHVTVVEISTLKQVRFFNPSCVFFLFCLFRKRRYKIIPSDICAFRVFWLFLICSSTIVVIKD